MKLFLLFLALLASSEAERESRITRGQTASPHEFPSIIHMKLAGGSTWCGGTLVNSRTVLTAAHCQTHANNLRVYAGAHYASQADNSHDVQKALVSRVIIHPRYDTRTHRYDFMILKLDRDIWESGTVKYVRLPTTDAFPDAYTECFIVGWGMVNKYSRTSDVLMKGTATATSYSNEVLHAKPSGSLKSSTCKGDSGGPLYCPAMRGGAPYQVGLLTGGDGVCGSQHGMIHYARIGFVLDWIRANS